MIEHKPTFCRICEPLCGMIATVEDGRLVALRPDKEHPLSGVRLPEGHRVHRGENDPDRVTTAAADRDGFEPVAGTRRCPTSRHAVRHPRGTVRRLGWYMGNPGAFSYAHLSWALVFIKGLGRHATTSPHRRRTPTPRLASQLLYGTPTSVPIPDLTRTDLLVMMGANPVVSHGSFLTAARIKDRMHDIVKRGGRVVVIDPRRTETAAQFEWLGIVPDGDAFLLLSLLQVMFAEGLVDRAGVAAAPTGWTGWSAGANRSPRRSRPHTGVEPDAVRGLARDLAAHAAGRRLRTARYLRRPERHADHVSDRRGQPGRGQPRSPGGRVFSSLGIAGPAVGDEGDGRAAPAILSAETVPCRRDSARLIGSEPAALMAKEITTAGPARSRRCSSVRATRCCRCPTATNWRRRSNDSDLMVALDFYVTETTAHCDYILPVTTMYERDDFPFTFQAQFQATPFRQATEAVVAPAGEARPEWDIVDDLMTRMHWRSPAFAGLAALRKALRRLRRSAHTPRR